MMSWWRPWPREMRIRSPSRTARLAFAGLCVQLYLAAFTRALGFRSGLEETRDVEPHIEANGVVHADIVRGASPPPKGLQLATSSAIFDLRL